MCGIGGFIDPKMKAFDNPRKIAQLMGEAIANRGPDASGCWVNSEDAIVLVHRRLSILELSEAGAQPMLSESGRYVISYNGEIYNHMQLRQELEATGLAPNWQGQSDTETLIAGFDAWGVKPTIERTTGMFAFAVWDKKENTLILVRDRVGEKPLYYGWQNGVFLFGSELSVLKQHPSFKGEINRDAVALLMRHNCIPAPHSVYQGIYKLEAGCILTISAPGLIQNKEQYWSAVEVARTGINNPFSGTPEEAVDQLEDICRNSVQKQMIADVPLGAFLSGGIDSSIIVSLMQSLSSQPVKTFTIGFFEKSYNEAKHAKAVAAHLGTDHTELYVTPDEAMNIIPHLPKLYCEPFSDSSQIPTFLVSQLAKQHVSVSLSGDAGDELFCGYNRYKMTNDLWKKLSVLPVPVRKFVANRIRSVSPDFLNKLTQYTPLANRFNNIGDKLHKGAGVLTAKSSDELYMRLVSHHTNPEKLVISSQEPPTLLTGHRPDLTEFGEIERMMALDSITYLPDDILVKVDRAAMGVSLETRVPFLDHHVVEFAWKLPLSIKLNNGQPKWPLKQLLYRYVPSELIDRPKMGFGIPLARWLRGPLREWAESLLNDSRLRNEGIFESEPVRKLWSEHLSEKQDWAHLLWNILMFQAWYELQK